MCYRIYREDQAEDKGVCYNEELAKLHFLGGGAMLMKHFAKLDKNRVHFIEDINANAKGYKYLPNHGLAQG